MPCAGSFCDNFRSCGQPFDSLVYYPGVLAFTVRLRRHTFCFFSVLPTPPPPRPIAAGGLDTLAAHIYYRADRPCYTRSPQHAPTGTTTQHVLSRFHHTCKKQEVGPRVELFSVSSSRNTPSPMAANPGTHLQHLICAHFPLPNPLVQDFRSALHTCIWPVYTRHALGPTRIFGDP